MAVWDPRTVQDAIVQVLADNNTTTSSTNISSSLTTAVADDMILKGRPKNTPVPRSSYPFITVYAISDEEDFTALGAGRRQVTSEFQIAAFCQGGVSGSIFGDPGEGADLADIEAMVLAKNIKACIRANTTLSTTVLWAQPVATEYRAEVAGAEEQVWISAAVVTVRCQALSS